MEEKSSKHSCPYCGSVRVTKKGFAIRKSGRIQLRRCKDCKRRFPEEKLRRKYGMPKDLAEKYIMNVTSLESLQELTATSLPEGHHPSKTTYHRNICELAKSYPTWQDLLKIPELRDKWGFILGVDTTTLRIKAHDYCYLHVVDIPSGDHLAYEIFEKEDAVSIKHVLRNLRDAGYIPHLVVTDLAPEILSAVKETFPEAKFQGCLFHLQQWLNKQLPTKKKRVDRQTLQLRRRVKQLIKHIAEANDVETRQRYLKELETRELDEKSSSVVQVFLGNIQYYHTTQELIWLGCKREYRYNNICERSIRAIKDLKRRMYGFKSVKNTSDYINLYWNLKRTRKAISHQKEATKILEYDIPLLLFGKRTNLAELSEETGINVEILKAEAERAGFIVDGSYVFSQEWLHEASEKLKREKPRTLKDAIKIIGDIPWSLFKDLGFELMIYSMDPAKILLKPVHEVTNETEQNLVV